MGGTNKGDDEPNLDVATRPQVGLLPFRCGAAGYALKHSLHLHSKEDIHRHNKGGEVTIFLEAGLHIILPILLLCHLKTFLWWLSPVRDFISVHDTHVMNNSSPYLPEVTDEKISLLL